MSNAQLDPRHLGLAISHLNETSSPWVSIPGGELRLVHVDIAAGIWVIANRFEPGMAAQRHLHTGPVFAWTTAGCWMYSEYGVRYEAGSFVHEPAGSMHTLVVPADNTETTEVFFVMNGANLNLDDDDNIVSITDAGSIAAAYRMLCEMQGKTAPSFNGA
ncbi:MAG: 2,4'-dihydroxyacetophenone dioxygenase family protein [Actinomycetota bacterium]|jgi:2,4'-dihydroxyacetophenone dioxygenase